ncbi:MAG: sigma-54 dependent transcriptional regulator [Pseudomonadota bacterium]|nr:sigma-54 dependent transcriptional regulator [Pseudomonadota bacterium]
MQTPTALVIDDERDIRELLVVTLTRMGLRVETASTVISAKQLLASQDFDFCLTDMRLPDGSGMEILAHISEHYPLTPAAMITAFGNVEAAVEALKAGAFDFVAKPVDLGVLRDLVRNALKLRAERNASPGSILPATNSATAGSNPAAAGQSPKAAATQSCPRLRGQSPAMEQLRQTIAKVARSQAPVYIWGESGTGKELTARSIHEESPRASGPFIPVNCGAIPAELMESEFFGHKKGSFTGAHADKDGLFQAAHGGTLFLDEVAELPLPMQVKLLRAIQEKTVRPVGAAAEIKVDVRILSATHKDLARLVEEGKFRHDLYYRINVIELRVPPLRERRSDLPLLAEGILKHLGEAHGVTPPVLDASAIAALNQYPFPGNIRELENLLERAMTMSDGDRIMAADLHLPSNAPTGPLEAPAPGFSAPPSSPSYQAPTAPATAASLLAEALDSESGLALPEVVEQMERATIEQALAANRYNKTKTAAQLGITFRALRYKLKKLGID